MPVPQAAALPLRMEDQLGFKMVTRIRRIEVVADYRHLGQGHGGWREDNQFYATDVWSGP